METWQKIARVISEETGNDFSPTTPHIRSGGCINDAFSLRDQNAEWFVKTNHPSQLEMFEAEADGLHALHASASFVVPEPLCTGTLDNIAYIVIEQLHFGPGSRAGWQQAGEQLALMHRQTHTTFGWRRTNSIGATTQHNHWEADWVVFWQQNRLGFQLEEAARNGYMGTLQRAGEKLLARIPVLLDHAPPPSLLHGDLWSGNLAFTSDGKPTIYDPAVYYGDREADLAMTELFGGFSSDFYAAYQGIWPIDAGYRVRKQLYNLYHILNHLNLFGGGYRSQAEQMMQRLLAEC